jgi:hypothetical protein
MKSVFSEVKGTIWEPILKILVSVLFGGIFYSFWLATFLLVDAKKAAVEWILWGIAPFITGLGFTIGSTIYNRIIGHRKDQFYRVLIWPLIGCVVGSAAVFWYGPMLIVFTMLILGTVSLVLRESLEYSSNRRSEEPGS